MWRAVSRRPLFTFLAQGSRTPTVRRPLHASLPRRAQQTHPPRRPGFYQWVRFKQNGTPRSTPPGYFEGYLVLCILFDLSLQRPWNLEARVRRKCTKSLANLHCVDEGYADLDLNDPKATLIYYKRLCNAVQFNDLTSLLQATREYLGSLGEDDPLWIMHPILQASIEQIHEILGGPISMSGPNSEWLEQLENVINSMTHVHEDLLALVVKKRKYTETIDKDYGSLGEEVEVYHNISR